MRLDRIVLAANDMDAMVDFYNTVFDSKLRSTDGSPLVLGVLAGTDLVLCPNTIAGVVAEQNRHQLRFTSEDPESTANRVLAAGGSIVNRGHDNDRLVIGIADPDGNTYELVGSDSSGLT